MTDIRVKDLTEAAAPGADYWLLTDSATDGPKKIKTSNIVTKLDLGLDQVNNTSDASKPVSTATAAALATKADSSSLGALATKNKIAVTDVNAAGTPSASTWWRGDGVWSTPAGGGDMVASVYAPRIYDFDTRTAAIAAHITAPQNLIRTGGYTNVGDGGGAFYQRVVSLGTNQVGFQSADGSWWQLIVIDCVDVKTCGAKGDGVTDDAAAIQAAINLCLNGARPVPLKVTSICSVGSSIIINRAVGSSHGADTFRIIGMGPFAGFTTSAAITIIDSTLPYAGGTGPSSCNIRFENITFLGTATTSTFAVSDKFIKVHFEACRFNLIRCVLATYYLQSWRWHHCSMIGWVDWFCSNTATYYDCRWESCDFESGGNGIKSFNGGFDGSSIINCLFENSGRFFSQAIGLGTTIVGNYTEGNSAPDYQLSDIAVAGYHRGTIFSGNFMAGNTHTLHNVIVGNCQGMLAGGNYTDAKLYDTTGTTPGSFKSIGDYAGTSKFSTLGSFDGDHAGDYVEAVLPSSSATSLTTGTAKTITSIVLSPGDWDVSGVVGYIPAGSTSVTRYSSSISLTANTVGGDGNGNINVFAAFVSGGFAVDYPTPVVRVSVAATTTVYLVGFADFTAGTMTAFGKICARKAGGQ